MKNERIYEQMKTFGFTLLPSQVKEAKAKAKANNVSLSYVMRRFLSLWLSGKIELDL